MNLKDLIKLAQSKMGVTPDGIWGEVSTGTAANYDLVSLTLQKKSTQALPPGAKPPQVGIPLNEKQRTGFNYIVGKWNESGLTDIRWLAYMLATAWHETAFTLEPVSEYGGEAYLKSKPYWPYYGRGYVQLTWKENYAKYGIADDVSKALDPEFAAYVMIDGMTKGIFTGKKLSDYFNSHTDDPVQARRIINGMDRAEQIAGYYRQFLEMVTPPKAA